MYFTDFKQKLNVKTIKEMIELLKIRYNNNSNHFVLSHNNSGLPELSFFVKENICVAYYIIDDECYFVSQSNIDLDEDVVFYENDMGSEITLSKYCVISAACIEATCIYFFNHNKIPNTIEWNEL